DAVQVSDYAFDPVDSMHQVMPIAVVDRANVTVNSQAIDPGRRVKKGKGPSAVGSSCSASGLRAVSRRKTESCVEGRVHSISDEGQVAARIIGRQTDPIGD